MVQSSSLGYTINLLESIALLWSLIVSRDDGQIDLVIRPLYDNGRRVTVFHSVTQRILPSNGRRDSRCLEQLCILGTTVYCPHCKGDILTHCAPVICHCHVGQRRVTTVRNLIRKCYKLSRVNGGLVGCGQQVYHWRDHADGGRVIGDHIVASRVLPDGGGRDGGRLG